MIGKLARVYQITLGTARHGLYVREAISHTERAIQEAQARGDREIRLIVGMYMSRLHTDSSCDKWRCR